MGARLLRGLLLTWAASAAAFRVPPGAPPARSLRLFSAARPALRPARAHGRSAALRMTAAPPPASVGGPEGECFVLSPVGLKNTYFAVRHGHAVNNLESLISSSPAVGTKIHPLTDLGKEQAAAASAELCAAMEAAAARRGAPFSTIVAYTSDFTRARETAEICLAGLSGMKVAEQAVGSLSAGIRTELRERWFGTLDDTVVTNYNMVWPEDLKNARSDAGYECESVEQVVTRLQSLITAMEGEHEDAAIVFFSHADTVQIFQTWMSGADVRKFSQYRFKNGEVRELVLNNPDSLPPPQPLNL